MFSFSINNARRGTGFALGTGILVNQSSTNDGVASVTVQNINISLRVGIEKKYFVIVQSVKEYSKAKATAVKIAGSLKQKLDLRNLKPIKAAGLTYSKKDCENTERCDRVSFFI